MPVVTLRAPLKDRAGGASEVTVEGHTVGEVLSEIERAHPKLGGWMLDDQGRVRRHVNVFLNGEGVREDAAVGPEDRLHVLPSITGG
jgi:molybdopterin synthase sulfur carrier subunit